jgi:hypothetical protein
MIAHYNNKSLALGIPGLILQIGGNIGTRATESPGVVSLMLLASLVGTVLLMVGLAYYAKAKGRSPWWCLMGFLSLIGLIVLAFLKDKAPDGQVVAS